MQVNSEATPYQQVPEICIEIVSPSNSQAEMKEKIQLYLEYSMVEVWVCHVDLPK
ncbi:Uma2 family endonuclease [Candidatus Venteria ishoeyi]|uniref:Uma2 family endonuclease n=1 Tax=Candidatus Venteria ishoeyi TaxID=1899563 RepID=UPI00255C7232|nr:Uma2 family endonuclease [Candidatus Venteria ishoeyi]